MIGRLLAAPFRLLNVPARTMEKLFGDDHPDERILSKPLESIAEAVEEAVDGDKESK